MKFSIDCLALHNKILYRCRKGKLLEFYSFTQIALPYLFHFFTSIVFFAQPGSNADFLSYFLLGLFQNTFLRNFSFNC